MTMKERKNVEEVNLCYLGMFINKDVLQETYFYNVLSAISVGIVKKWMNLQLHVVLNCVVQFRFGILRLIRSFSSSFNCIIFLVDLGPSISEIINEE